jgi:hypothetical protein
MDEADAKKVARKKNAYMDSDAEAAKMGDWEEKEDESGAPYWENKVTGEKTWEKPKQVAPAAGTDAFADASAARKKRLEALKKKPGPKGKKKR